MPRLRSDARRGGGDAAMLQTAFDASMSAILDQAGRPGLVIVALSGGVDSVALLDLAKKWFDRLGGGIRLAAAHLNHSIRGADADADADFCREYARSLGVAFYSRKSDVPALAAEKRLGVEEAGRLARHLFFLDVAGDDKAVVATAHHADDQAETILLHLRRGAHRRGLRGMERVSVIPVRTDGSVVVVRPLLETTKAEILRYAAERGLAWREDATNGDVAFERNRIRHGLIPSMESILPGFRRRLLDKARAMAIEEETLTAAGRDLAVALSRRENGGRLFRLEAEAFRDSERLLYAFRHLLEEEMGGRLPYGAVLSRLAVLAESGRIGDGLSLPGDMLVRKERDGLFFFFPRSGGDAPAAEVILPDPPFTISVGDLTVGAEWLPAPESGLPPGDDMLDSGVEWMNPLAIRWPLSLRPPIPGERFRPLGAPGSRKLQDIMVDLKVPRRKRGEPRVVSDHAGAIWLWPYRLAHRVRLEKRAGKALRMSIFGEESRR